MPEVQDILRSSINNYTLTEAERSNLAMEVGIDQFFFLLNVGDPRAREDAAKFLVNWIETDPEKLRKCAFQRLPFVAQPLFSRPLGCDALYVTNLLCRMSSLPELQPLMAREQRLLEGLGQVVSDSSAIGPIADNAKRVLTILLGNGAASIHSAAAESWVGPAVSFAEREQLTGDDRRLAMKALKAASLEPDLVPTLCAELLRDANTNHNAVRILADLSTVNAIRDVLFQYDVVRAALECLASRLDSSRGVADPFVISCVNLLGNMAIRREHFVLSVFY